MTFCVTSLCVAVIAGVAIWLPPASGVHAANVSTAFMVSVRVVGRCRLEDPDMSLPASELLLSCTPGTGYQILMDGRPAGAGAAGGVMQLLPLTAASNAPPGGPAVSQIHWLTILY